MKRVLSKTGMGVCLLGSILSGYSQDIDPNALGYYQDAYLFARQYHGGTARFQGFAGAGTALGGDLSSLAMNPAGLGFFNKSEWSVSPALGFNNSSSSYDLGNTFSGPTRDSRSNFNFGQLGVVFNNTKDDIVPGGWRGVNWGVGLTRQNSYHQQLNYTGINKRNSLIDWYLERSTAYNPDDLFDQANSGQILNADALGFAAYLVDFGNFSGDSLDPGSYNSHIDPVDTRQSERITRSGAQNSLDIAFGTNYDDRLYLGGGLGIQFLNHRERMRYEEVTLESSPLRNFVTNDELDFSAIGINLNLGVIYRPDDHIRLGISYRSPTAYRVNSTYYSNITVNYNNWSYPFNGPNDPPLNTLYFETLRGSYNYRITTPHRLNMGIAVFAGKNGFISADAEYVQYDRATLKALDGLADFGGDNRTIASIFAPTFNLRVGGEYRYDFFRFRGGYAFYPSGVVNNALTNNDTRFITVGAGIRMDEYYVDLAVVNRTFKTGYTPYTLSWDDTPAITTKHNQTNVMVTIGVFF